MDFLPNIADVHVDRLLTDISIAVMNEPNDYVLLRTFPMLTVLKQSDRIAVYDQYAWLADEAIIRAPGTETEGSGWTVSSTSYNCQNYSSSKNVPLEVRANQDTPYNLDEEAVLYTVDKILMKLEIQFVNTCMVAGSWGANETTLSGANQWSNTTSAILSDIENAKIAVGNKIVREPNVMVVGRAVWGAIMQHPSVVGRMSVNTTRIVTQELVAALFDFEKVLVAKAVRATNKQGQALAKDRVIGKNALFAYAPSRPSLLSPSAGYTFNWSALGPGFPIYTRRVNMPLRMSDRIESHGYFDIVKTSTDAAYLYVNAVA